MNPAQTEITIDALTANILGLVLIAGLAAGLFILILVLSQKSQRKKARKRTYFKIALPEENEIDLKAGVQMFSSLYGLRKSGLFNFGDASAISFEITATHDEISFYASTPTEFAPLLEKQIHASYPEAEIETVPPYNIWKKGGKVAFCSMKLSGPSYYPINTFEKMGEKVDPLNGLISPMSKLSESDAVALQILLKPASPSWQVNGRNYIFSLKQRAKGTDDKPGIPLDEEHIKGIEAKCGKLGFDTIVRISSVAEDSSEAFANLDNLANSFSQFVNPMYNSFSRKTPVFGKRNFMYKFLLRLFPIINFDIPKLSLPLFKESFVLNSEELATMFHFPNKNVKVPHINWIKARVSAAPTNLPKEGLYLGFSEFRGEKEEVHIQEDDRRRHMYIIGQTGTGKSEFMKYLAVQDIKAGKGIAFIDPHGTAIEDILKQIPPERAKDVIYFSPGDLDRPMGINILEAKTEEQKHMLINSFIALLYKLYDPNKQGIMGPMLERGIRNVMLTAMSEPGNTLVEVLRLLIDPEFAKTKLPLITDPMVKEYWTKQLAQTSDFHKSEMLGYFISKFDRFVTEKVMRNIIGQAKSAFDFREVMDQGKILLVDLAKGKIGEENSNFLGLILVPRILAAAMGRVDVSEDKRRDFFLYVDEFQNFATETFAEILSEARKYHLSLIVANQFISQLSDEIKNAVFGNVGTLVAFRVGVDDAEYLKTQFEPKFTESDLINNPTGRVYMRLLVKGQPTTPFSLTTDWEKMKSSPRSEEIAKQIVEYSRMQYGKDRAEVEEDILKRAGWEESIK